MYVFYSLGKSCMTLFWIGWCFSYLSSILQLSLSLWDGYAQGAEDSGDTAQLCKGFGIASRPLWHMQLLFSISWSSSPLSRTALLLKKCLSLLSAFCASTISFTVRGYILSSSLQFAKTWFIRIVYLFRLGLLAFHCSRTKILSTSTTFGKLPYSWTSHA